MASDAYSAAKERIQPHNRIAELQAKSRVIWPQYDLQLNTRISRNQAYSLLEDVFVNSGYYNDWLEFQAYKNINAIIDSEDIVNPNIGKYDQTKSNQYSSPRRSISFKQGSPARKYSVKSEDNVRNVSGEFNQIQISNIIRNLYLASNDRPQGSFTTRRKDDYQSDYENYHQRIQEMAHDKKWSKQELMHALANRQQGESQWEIWRQHIVDQGTKMNYHNSNPAVVDRLMKDAEETRMLKQRIQEEKDDLEFRQSRYLANKNTEKYFEAKAVRSPEAFLDDQIKFEQRRFERLRVAQYQTEVEDVSQLRPKPTISGINQSLVSPRRSQNGSFYMDVNHSIRKKKEREEQIRRDQEAELKFNPAINKQKTVKRGFIDLVEDTNRRLSSKHRLEQNLRKKFKVDSVQINSTSDVVLHDRYDQDFQKINKKRGLQQQITFADFQAVFLELGFTHNPAKDGELSQLEEIWRNILKGDYDAVGKVPKAHVKNIGRAILNFHHQEVIDQNREGSFIDTQAIGRINGRFLQFKTAEIEYITKTYCDLFQNRQDKVAADKRAAYRQRAANKWQRHEYSFSPQLAEKSLRMAKTQRANSSSKLRVVENRLLKKQKQYLQAAEEKRLQKDEDSTLGLSFHPDISTEKPTPRQDVIKSQYSSQWDYLYKDSHGKSKLYKQDTLEDEVALSKQPEEYTFRPDIRKSNNSPQRRRLRRSPNRERIN